MIPVQTQRSVETSPVAASASFGISQNDVAHILTMLRDTLYSDRVLAVLREYAANVEYEPFTVDERPDGATFAVLPHPSGINRIWCRSENVKLARETVETAIRL